MPSTVIPCKDCEKTKKALENGGGVEVVSCESLLEDANKPKAEQRCVCIQPPPGGEPDCGTWRRGVRAGPSA